MDKTFAQRIIDARQHGFDVIGPGRQGRGFPCFCAWGSGYHGMTCPEHGVRGLRVVDLEAALKAKGGK